MASSSIQFPSLLFDEGESNSLSSCFKCETFLASVFCLPCWLHFWLVLRVFESGEYSSWSEHSQKSLLPDSCFTENEFKFLSRSFSILTCFVGEMSLTTRILSDWSFRLTLFLEFSLFSTLSSVIKSSFSFLFFFRVDLLWGLSVLPVLAGLSGCFSQM